MGLSQKPISRRAPCMAPLRWFMHFHLARRGRMHATRVCASRALKARETTAIVSLALFITCYCDSPVSKLIRLASLLLSNMLSLVSDKNLDAGVVLAGGEDYPDYS